MPHVCERVIYFLQTDDEEYELKPEYWSETGEDAEGEHYQSENSLPIQSPNFTMSGSEMDGMDEFSDKAPLSQGSHHD